MPEESAQYYLQMGHNSLYMYWYLYLLLIDSTLCEINADGKTNKKCKHDANGPKSL